LGRSIYIPLKELTTYLLLPMSSEKWVPSEEEKEVMQAVWMQVMGACKKLKEETRATDEHIRKMLQEMSDHHFS